MSQFRIAGRRFQDYFDTDIVDCAYPPARVKLDMATVLGAYQSRCLITLDTGHFGLAPHHVERGDKLFVLQGCSLPIRAATCRGQRPLQSRRRVLCGWVL